MRAHLLLCKALYTRSLLQFVTSGVPGVLPVLISLLLLFVCLILGTLSPEPLTTQQSAVVSLFPQIGVHMCGNLQPLAATDVLEQFNCNSIIL